MLDGVYFNLSRSVSRSANSLETDSSRFPEPSPVSQQPEIPRVSVIVNNFNYGRFLASAIESALSQSYASTEIIVVDDGSTDESRDVLRSYERKIVAIYKANGGQASAMNAGFARSSGSIVFFLDADDMLEPDIVERVVKAFAHNGRLAKVHFRMALVDADGMPTGEQRPPSHVGMLEGDLRRHYLTFPDDVWRLPTSGNAFARWALESLFPMPEEPYRVNADSYLTHLTPLLGDVTFLEDTGAQYRMHGKNLYETTALVLNLDRVRVDLKMALATHGEIRKLVATRGLRTAGTHELALLSTSFIINRMILLKLDPSGQTIAGDSRARLVRLGCASAWRRFDVSILMRIVYMVWFASMAVAPSKLARWLALAITNPQTRPWLNALLCAMQRPKALARTFITGYMKRRGRTFTSRGGEDIAHDAQSVSRRDA